MNTDYAIDKFFDWLNSNHWTTRLFLSFFKSIFVLLGLVVCWVIMTFSGENHFQTFREMFREDEIEVPPLDQ